MQPIEALIELERRGEAPDRFRPLLQEMDQAGLLSSQNGGLPGIAGIVELYSRGVLNDMDVPDYNREMRRRYFPLMQRLVGAGLVTPYVPEAQRESSLGRLVRHGFTGGFSDEIRAGLGALGDVTRGALTGVDTNLSDSYDYNLAVERSQVRNARAQTGVAGMAAEMVGGIAMPLYRNPNLVAQGAAPAMTTGQRVQSFAGQGAGYGAITGFAEAEGGVENRIVGTATGGVAGGVIGGGLGYGLSRWGDWRAARRAAAEGRQVEAAATNQNVVNEFNQAGVPVFAPAISDSPTMQTTASSMMNSVMGGPLVNRSNQAVAGIENRLAETIAEAGGRRAGDEMGQEVQQLLRRNMTEYSVPNAQINRMAPGEAEAITHVPTGPGYIPPRPVAEAVAPVEVQAVRPRQITIDEVRVQAPRVDPEPVRTNYRPFESVTLEEVNPQLAQRIAAARAEIEGISRIHNERILPAAQQAENAFRRDMNGLFREIQGDAGFSIALRERGIRNLDDFINTGLGEARSAFGPGDPFRSVRQRYNQIGQRFDEALRPYQESVSRYDAAAARIRQMESQGERVRDEAWRLMVQNEHGNAVRRAEATTSQRRVAAETSARETEMRRLQGLEDERAVQETARMRGAAHAEADRATRARQREIDAKYEADMQNYTPRFTPGASREHTYPTEFAAAYRQAEANARGPIGHYMAPIYEHVPPVKKEVKIGPVRTGNYIDVPQKPIAHRTATMNLLNDFGREARANGRLTGWKDFDFEAPAFWSYLRGRLGDDVASRLQDGLNRQTVGRLPISGLRDIRTDVRRAAEARPVEGVHMGDQAMLRRLHGAMSEDMQTMLRKAGKADPAYTAAADQYRMIDSAYERFVTEFRRPLRALFGEQVAPEVALRRLQSAAQTKTQDLQLLRNFYRVATEKGDVKRATGIIVSNMAEGGLPAFLKQYGGLSTEAKKIMFAGNAGELGNALERLHRLARRMEPYIVDGRGLDLTTLTRMSNLSLGGIAFMVNIPAAIGQAVGMHAMARLMASDKFVNWLTRMPRARTPWTPEFTQQIDRLRGIAIEELGLNEQAWEALRPNIVRNIRGRPLSRAA